MRAVEVPLIVLLYAAASKGIRYTPLEYDVSMDLRCGWSDSGTFVALYGMKGTGLKLVDVAKQGKENSYKLTGITPLLQSGVVNAPHRVVEAILPNSQLFVGIWNLKGAFLGETTHCKGVPAAKSPSKGKTTGTVFGSLTCGTQSPGDTYAALYSSHGKDPLLLEIVKADPQGQFSIKARERVLKARIPKKEVAAAGGYDINSWNLEAKLTGEVFKDQNVDSSNLAIKSDPISYHISGEFYCGDQPSSGSETFVALHSEKSNKLELIDAAKPNDDGIFDLSGKSMLQSDATLTVRVHTKCNQEQSMPRRVVELKLPKGATNFYIGLWNLRAKLQPEGKHCDDIPFNREAMRKVTGTLVCGDLTKAAVDTYVALYTAKGKEVDLVKPDGRGVFELRILKISDLDHDLIIKIYTKCGLAAAKTCYRSLAMTISPNDVYATRDYYDIGLWNLRAQFAGESTKYDENK